jgi:hypothetical protein
MGWRGKKSEGKMDVVCGLSRGVDSLRNVKKNSECFEHVTCMIYFKVSQLSILLLTDTSASW